MQLEYAFLATFSEPTPDGKANHLGAGLNTIFVSQVPAVHPNLYLTVMLEFTEEESNNDFDFTIELIDPNGAQVNPDVRGTVRPRILDATFPPRAMIICAFQQLLIASFGRYLIRVSVGGALLKELPITVRNIAEFHPALPGVPNAV